MLRDIQVGSGKAVNAMFAAGEAMTTGMGVVKNIATGEVEFPAAATASEIFFVQKARYPKGINASRTNFSDYDSDFVNIAKGEKVVLCKYEAGEIFATDAYATATKPTAGKVVVVNTDGELIDATSPATSIYKYIGDRTDGGHTLLKIEVLDTAATNA